MSGVQDPWHSMSGSQPEHRAGGVLGSSGVAPPPSSPPTSPSGSEPERPPPHRRMIGRYTTATAAAAALCLCIAVVQATTSPPTASVLIVHVSRICTRGGGCTRGWRPTFDRGQYTQPAAIRGSAYNHNWHSG